MRRGPDPNRPTRGYLRRFSLWGNPRGCLQAGLFPLTLTLYGHIKTAEQQTIIHQYGGGGWAVTLSTARKGLGCPLLVVPNVTAHPSTASVPTS